MNKYLITERLLQICLRCWLHHKIGLTSKPFFDQVGMELLKFFIHLPSQNFLNFER